MLLFLEKYFKLIIYIKSSCGVWLVKYIMKFKEKGYCMIKMIFILV